MSKQENPTQSPFNVLVACEESQAISGEIRRYAARYDLKIQAYSCDLLPTSAPDDQEERTGKEHHLHGDALKMLAFDPSFNYEEAFCERGETAPKTLAYVLDNILGRGATLEERESEESPWGWDMIIANPPCTYLAVSGARWYHDPKDPDRGYHPRFPSRRIERAESIRLLLSIALAPCKYIVIENPVGTLKSNLNRLDPKETHYGVPDYNIGVLPKEYLRNLDIEIQELKEKIENIQEDPVELKGLQKYLARKESEKKSKFEGAPIKIKELQETSSFSELVELILHKKLPPWSELKTLSGRSTCDWLTDAPPCSEDSSNTKQPDLFEKTFSPYPIMVQPYMFGETASKKTCLWVKGITRGLKKTKEVHRGERVVLSSGRSLPKWYSDALTKAKTPEERRTLRSKTFIGVARAIVVQWVMWAAAQEGKGGLDIERYQEIEQTYFDEEKRGEKESSDG